MTTYTPQSIVPSGVEPTYNAAAAGDKVTVGASERDLIHIKNGGAVSLAVTVAAAAASIYQEGVGNITVPAITRTIEAGDEGVMGPFPASYVQADGTIAITWGATATVTWAALRLDPVSKSFN